MCFYMLKRKSSLEPTTAGQNIVPDKRGLKLSRLPASLAATFAALLSVSLTQQLRSQTTRIRQIRARRNRIPLQVIHP